MLRQMIFLMLSFLLILSACNSDDQISLVALVNLPFTADNLEGDWQRNAQFKGQLNDTLGILEPLEDLFFQLENCQKDDMIRYVKAPQQDENTYFWGIGDIPCHSQIANSFLEIGNWTLKDSGQLTHTNSNINEVYIVVILTPEQLLIRSESGILEANEFMYEFTRYERVK